MAMNPSELVAYVQSGPEELHLTFPLRFRRRTRTNPVDLNDFLEVLRSNTTIRNVDCRDHITLSVSEREWGCILLALGGMAALIDLKVYWTTGSHDFQPLQAVAHSVNAANSLSALRIFTLCAGNLTDSTGAASLATSVRHHASSLRTFFWFSNATHHSPLELEALFYAVAALPLLRCASVSDASLLGDSIRFLARSRSLFALLLSLCPESWPAVFNEIQSDSCTLRHLHLSINPLVSTLTTARTSTNTIQALARSLEHNTSLQHLELELKLGFSDQAVVALANALTVNTQLRRLQLVSSTQEFHNVLARSGHEGLLHVSGGEAYKALGEMLKSKRQPLELELYPLRSDVCPETRKQYALMNIELRLNNVGRGLLEPTSSKETWVRALKELNDAFKNEANGGEPAFHVGCLFSLFKLNPNLCKK